MNWFILIGILIAISIASIIYEHKSFSCSDWPFAVASIGISCSILLGVVCPIVYFSDKQEISTFKQERQYLATHTSKSQVEDAALTAEKAKLNKKLFDAQWSKNNLGGWSLEPDEVKSLKPIE